MENINITVEWNECSTILVKVKIYVQLTGDELQNQGEKGGALWGCKRQDCLKQPEGRAQSEVCFTVRRLLWL